MEKANNYFTIIYGLRDQHYKRKTNIVLQITRYFIYRKTSA